MIKVELKTCRMVSDRDLHTVFYTTNQVFGFYRPVCRPIGHRMPLNGLGFSRQTAVVDLQIGGSKEDQIGRCFVSSALGEYCYV